MDQVTQQNAAAAQQSASAAEQLTGQAAILKSMVDVLLATVEGASAAPTTAAANSVGTALIPRAEVGLKSAPTPTAARQVVPFKKKPGSGMSQTASLPVTARKKAVGAEEFPSVDDPRFEDV